jgi:hypothetical protein
MAASAPVAHGRTTKTPTSKSAAGRYAVQSKRRRPDARDIGSNHRTQRGACRFRRSLQAVRHPLKRARRTSERRKRPRDPHRRRQRLGRAASWRPAYGHMQSAPAARDVAELAAEQRLSPVLALRGRQNNRRSRRRVCHCPHFRRTLLLWLRFAPQHKNKPTAARLRSQAESDSARASLLVRPQRGCVRTSTSAGSPPLTTSMARRMAGARSFGSLIGPSPCIPMLWASFA